MNKMEEVTPNALKFLLETGQYEHVIASVQYPNLKISLNPAKYGKRQVFKVEGDGRIVYYSPGDIVDRLIRAAKSGKIKAQLEETLDNLVKEMLNIPNIPEDV